ncbi:heavy-metal-associated domain-containing protein [Flavobacterium macacae]|uniref:Cation transporter n=1 Tax=Flavobacterium macacae TaxID=2488993 RepID=A0A3P3WI79_9FLAO|nr:cation transporter [Flavobacterium macacae]RRJ93689.1 cation transporter [Flavobacterium macacae]
MKKIMFVLFVSLIGFSSQAQEKKNKNAKKDIEVKGNCEMCKKRIEKAAFSVPGVKSAEWHQDDQTLHLIVNEEKTDALKVQQAIAKVGHDTKEVRATDEDYGKLHTCCSYERN